VDDRTIFNIARFDGDSWQPLGGPSENGLRFNTGDDDGFDVAGVSDMHVHDQRLYVTGSFELAGSQQANGIAVWDGADWSPLGTGIRRFSDSVGEHPANGFDITNFNGKIYVSGAIDRAGSRVVKNIAAWNGASWEGLGSGVAPGVNISPRAMQAFAGSLYIGGAFDRAGDISAEGVSIRAFNIVRWDGNWHPLESQDVNGSVANGVRGAVNAFELSGNTLVVGGRFNGAGSVETQSILTWNGSAWGGFGLGLEAVNSRGLPDRASVEVLKQTEAGLLVGGDILFAGGARDINFEIIEENRVGDLVTWANGRWEKQFGAGIGQGIGGTFPGTGEVRSFTFTGAGALFVGSSGLDWTGEIPMGCPFGFWSGVAWDTSPSLTSACIPRSNSLSGNALLESGTSLYLGFSGTEDFGGKSLNGIAKFDGTSWKPLGPLDQNGLTAGFATTLALAEHSDSIVVGGNFISAGPVAANNIALWDGVSWSALGDGLPDTVHAIEVFKGEIFAAINRTRPTRGSVRRWDGATWQVLGEDPPSGEFWALEAAGDRLYVGGRIFLPDDPDKPELVVFWDGNQWSRLGEQSAMIAGDLDRVTALAALGQQLYAGGRGIGSSDGFGNVAFWDGFTWKRLGEQQEKGLSRVDSDGGFVQVRKFNLSKEGLYMAGGFSRAGGRISRNIARFVPINELDLRVSLEEVAARAQLAGSKLISATSTADILLDLIVRNQGTGGVMGSDIDLDWTPSPEQLSWTCQPLPEGNAECPAESGTGALGPTLDLSAGGGLQFTLSLTPAADAVFQDIRASISADDVIGVTGVTSDSLNVSLPVSTEGVFKDEFE